MKKEVAPYLARKYADAFVNIFGDELTVDDARVMQATGDFLASKHSALFFLRLPIIKDAVKREVLVHVAYEFKLPTTVHILIDVLLHDKRASLIPSILHAISKLYYKRTDIASFTITSSHALSQEQLDRLVGFLEAWTQRAILYTHAIDPTLIAGIRMQSDTLLWEYSIHRKLAQIQQLFMR